MKRILALTCVIFTACMLIAQDAPKPPTAPVIPPNLVKDYFKATTKQAQAQVAVDQAQKNLEATTQEVREIGVKVNASCGEKYQATIDQKSGDPICVPVPEVHKAPAAPTKK